MKARTGRPPKLPNPQDQYSTLTVRLQAQDKALLITMAEGYGMTLTEYLMTLVHRDSTNAASTNPS